jgi:hypothetical protein
MRNAVRLPPSLAQDRRYPRTRVRRLEISKFQSWQRWAPSCTAPLVRLVRLLTR